MELTPTMILNLALLIVPPVALVLVFRQWLARHIRWAVALTALYDVLLFCPKSAVFSCNRSIMSLCSMTLSVKRLICCSCRVTFSFPVLQTGRI